MPFYSQDYLAGEGSSLRSTSLNVGHHPRTLDSLMLPDRDRTMGMHIIGKAGSGKSSEIKNLVYQDAMKGNAVILIDPHDDLAEECVAELPQHRIADTHILDMRDEAFPFGCNVFALAGKITTEEEKTQAIERILHIFDVLWADILKQQYLPMLLRFAVIALLDTPGSTLPDMIDFFRKDEFRAQILSRVKDKTVRDYFHDEYDQFSDVERNRRVAPLMNRLHSLFVGRGLIRNILGQRVNSVDWRKVIEERQIVFVKLPTTTMREDARLIGMILVAQINAAIFSFVDTPPEKRPRVSVYVDEFQNFATGDFERLVKEGRKFGVQLVVAHQDLGQLPDYLQRATAGMQTRVVFRVSPEDARALAPIFPPRQAEGGTGDVDPHATKCLLEFGADDNNVRTFIDFYLRSLHGQSRSGGKIEVESVQRHTALDYFLWGASGGTKSGEKRRPEVFVTDPIPQLDFLLYQVMKTGNYLLPIPYDVVAGFSNCGRGFYGALGGVKHGPALTAECWFPAHLANETAHGWVWLRKPENDKERALHCIFHLRMVMMHLAEHPILKGSKASMLDYASILTQLPVRMALVKSGNDVGQISTDDTPAPLMGEALRARRYFIQQHTRQVYCHPRSQIESLIDQTTPPDPVTFRRWEEVRIVE